MLEFFFVLLRLQMCDEIRIYKRNLLELNSQIQILQLTTCALSLSVNSRWTGVELHRHPGSLVKHVSGLLADGVGTGCFHHRHGHC